MGVDLNPHEPRTIGVEFPAGRDRSLPLASSYGRGVLLDADTTEPCTGASMFIRTRTSTVLGGPALYAADMYDLADADSGQLAQAYSLPVAHVANSGGWLTGGGAGGGSLVGDVAQWPGDPRTASSILFTNPSSDAANPAVGWIRWKADPTFRDAASGAPVDLSDKRILCFHIKAWLAAFNPWNVTVRGIWNPTTTNGPDDALLEGGRWEGGVIPASPQGTGDPYLKYFTVGGTSHVRGGQDLRPADVVAMTTAGSGYFGLWAGYVLDGGIGAYPYALFVWSVAVLVTYGEEKRLAVGYASAEKNPNPFWPGKWVDFPWQDPTSGGVTNLGNPVTVTKTAGHRYVVVGRQIYFTGAGNDWRGLDCGTTVGFENYMLDGIASRDIPFQGQPDWQGEPAPQSFDPIGTRTPSFFLLGDPAEQAGAQAAITMPGAGTNMTAVSITVPVAGTGTSFTYPAGAGFGWRCPSSTVRTQIEFDPTVDLQYIAQDGDTSFLTYLPATDPVPAQTITAGTHSFVAHQLTDTAPKAADGFTWQYSPYDIRNVDIHIDALDAIAWEDDTGYREDTTVGTDTNTSFTTGSHWIRVIRSAPSGFLIDGCQPYVRPLSAIVWAAQVFRFRFHDIFETAVLRQDFSNATATDDYGVISIVIKNHSYLAKQTAPLHCEIRQGATVLAATDIVPADLHAPSFGDGLWYVVQKRLDTPITLSAGIQYSLVVTSTAAASVGWEILVLDAGDTRAAAVSYGGIADNVWVGPPNRQEDAWDALMRLSTVPDPLNLAAEVELFDCSHGLEGSCAVASLARIRVTWDPSDDGPDFAYYAIERTEDDGATWTVVANIGTLEDTTFVDVEMPYNRPVRYRGRQYRDDGIWSYPVETADVTAPLAEWAIVLGTNLDPDLAVSYLDEPNYQWESVDAGRTEVRYLQGRDFGMLLRESERRGDTFSRSFIVAFDDPAVRLDPALGGRDRFEPLLALAHRRDAPYITFCDHRGRRVFCAARVTDVNENEPGGQYLATVEFLQVPGPAPVDQHHTVGVARVAARPRLAHGPDGSEPARREVLF